LARLLWTQKQTFGPAPRMSHALAFDSNRSRVVMFGGETAFGPPSVLAGDTWEWDGNNWTQVEDIGPSARRRFAVAYDRNRNRLVLFGGFTASGPSGETWEWDGQEWTQVSETGPQERTLHAMAFDSSKNVVTLFGGQLEQEQTVLNDTWEWNGQDWTQQEDRGPDRSLHAMAYDDSRKRLVLFGGTDAHAQEQGDTWEWDGTGWTQRTDFGPPACSNPILVFTGINCVLFGGTHDGAFQNQTWTWDGTYWTARQDMGPSARSGHAAAFDSVRQRIVLFGGIDQAMHPLGDTWEQNADGGQATGPTP
jgi:Galactose oxidase, central domain